MKVGSVSFLFLVAVFFLYASFRLVQPLKCWPDLLDEVGRRGRPPLLAEGLGRARAGQPAGGPAGQDAGAGVGALGLEAVSPVHEDGAGAGQEVALAAAPGIIVRTLLLLLSSVSNIASRPFLPRHH